MMDFKIKHEIKGRLRVHMLQKRMTCAEADVLLYYLHHLDGVTEAKVYEKTGDAVILYKGKRETVIQGLKSFCYDQVEVPEGLIEHSGRELNAKYQGKLIQQTAVHFGKKLFIPYSVRALITA